MGNALFSEIAIANKHDVDDILVPLQAMDCGEKVSFVILYENIERNLIATKGFSFIIHK